MDIINKLSAILAMEITTKADIPINDQKDVSLASLQVSYRELVEQHSGQWLCDIGETIIATFDSPSDAVNCALASYNKFKNEQILITSSIHLGDIKAISNDIFGNSVNITLAMLNATPKDSIYISEMFFGSICYNKAYKTKLVGIKKLKGLRHSTTLFELIESQSLKEEELAPAVELENESIKKRASKKIELSFLVALSFIFIYIFYTFNTNTSREQAYSQVRLEILPPNHQTSSLNAIAIRTIIVDNIKEQNKLTVLTRERHALSSKTKHQKSNTTNLYSLTIEVQEKETQFFIQLTLIKPDKTEPISVNKLETNLVNLPKSLNSLLHDIYDAMKVNEIESITRQFTSNDLDLIGRFNNVETTIDTVTEKLSPLQSNLIDIEIKLQHCLYLANRINKKEIGSTLAANNCSFGTINNLSTQQRLKLATFYYLTNNISLASELTNSVLSINQRHYDAMLLKAKIAISTQRYVKANAILDELVLLFSGNSQITQPLASLYLHQGQVDLASQQINETLKSSNNQIASILDIVPVYKDTGFISEAILLIESLVNELNSSHLLFVLAELHFLNDNLEKSKDSLIKALKLSPNRPNYHSLLAETYYFLKDKTNAAYHYNKAIRLFVQNSNKNLAIDNAMLALCYARINKPFKAEDMIENALKQSNNDPDINYLAALVFHHMDKNDIANIYLDHAQALGLNQHKYSNSPSWKKLAISY